MRTGCTADFRAEMKKLKYHPSIKVEVAGDSYYVGDPDFDSRILALNHIERVYGGQAVVRLELASDTIEVDYRGKILQISYGFEIGYLDNPTATPALYTISDSAFSYNGVDYSENYFFFDNTLCELPLSGMEFTKDIDCGLYSSIINGNTSLYTIFYEHGSKVSMEAKIPGTSTEISTKVSIYTREGLAYFYNNPEDWTALTVKVMHRPGKQMGNTCFSYNDINYNTGYWSYLFQKSFPVLEYCPFYMKTWIPKSNISCGLYKIRFVNSNNYYHYTIFYSIGDKSTLDSYLVGSNSLGVTVSAECITFSDDVFIYNEDDDTYTYHKPSSWNIILNQGYDNPDFLIDTSDLIIGYFDSPKVTYESGGEEPSSYTHGTSEYVKTPSLRVYNQVYVSEPGINYMELECIDYWQVLDNMPCVSPTGNIYPPYWKSTKTVSEIFTQLLTGTGISVSVTSSDGNFNNASFKPYYSVEYLSSSIASVLIDIISMTQNSLRFNSNGNMKVIRLDITPGGYDYVYSLLDANAHRFFKNKLATKDSVPNTIIFMDTLPTEDTPPNYNGSAQDEDAIARWASSGFNGVIEEFYVNPMINSDSEADAAAESMLRRIQLNVASDEIEVPMNPLQEVLDYVQVQDERNSSEEDGIIGMINRTFVPGKYRMVIQFGGITIGLSSAASNQWFKKTGQQEIPHNIEYQDAGVMEKTGKQNTGLTPAETAESIGIGGLIGGLLLGPLGAIAGSGISYGTAELINKIFKKVPKDIMVNTFPAASVAIDKTTGKTTLMFRSDPSKTPYTVPEGQTPLEFITTYIATYGNIPGLEPGSPLANLGWKYNPETGNLEK